MFKLPLAVCVSYLCSLVSSQDDRPIITTPQGQVQGVTLTNNNGRTFYGFRGIPFAQPPVGDLRFMRPEAADSWTGVRDASVQSDECYQGFTGVEDCLYLNVYVPELPDNSTANRTVMVWIYGGAFAGGSADEADFGSGKLMNYDVITVTFNYRLGLFGYLSMADEVIPGNYGNWDQVQALRWVQENIAAFGGDPNSVAIFGQSAGAISTAILFLSPQTEGLFHAVIAESGTQVYPWMYQPNPAPYAVELAEASNCPLYNSTLMLACLQTKTADELYDAELTFLTNPASHPLVFVPVLDGQVEDGLFPDNPVNLIRDQRYNKVPFLSGMNYNEGIGMYLGLGTIDADYINANLTEIVYEYTGLTGDQLTQVTSLCYEQYYSTIDMDNLTALELATQNLLSDTLSPPTNYVMMQLLPKGESDPGHYIYVFKYAGEYMAYPEIGQTSHGDEIPYLFDVAADNNGILDTQDNITSERMLTFWTTFAKTGNPNPESSDIISVTWDAVTSYDTVPYMIIDTELSIEENIWNDRMLFWNNTILPIIYDV